MKVSYQWIKELTNINKDAKTIADTITLNGLEVEKIERTGIGNANVVSVEIMDIQKHPNADTLFITKVDAGSFGQKQIITNIKGLKNNQKVLAALEGAKLATGLEIKKTKLKGIDSEGMFVGWEELGVNQKSESLFFLDNEVKNGTNFNEIIPFNDSVINIELTANRGDCLGMIGVARDIKAIFNCELNNLETDYKTIDKDVKDIFSVEIKSKNCLRYCGAVILDVEIKPSPYWMQLRLIKAGIRPINNVVDITNYVLMECNQPLHAFDMDKINDKKIIIRDANKNEKLKTLDDQERTLTDTDMVISDPKIGHCIAGVMGGQISEVTDNTKNVFLEAAFFNSETIRKTSKQTGLKSESSYRFERGIDIDKVDWSLKRALYLFDQLKAGKVCKNIIDVYPKKINKKEIILTTAWVNNKLGTEIKQDEIISILKKLDFEINVKNENLIINVPYFRNDVSIKEDISEEIARIYGYNKIKPSYFPSINAAVYNPFQKFEKDLKDVLFRLKLNEVINFSFYGKSLFNKMLLKEDHTFRNIINIDIPLTDDWAGMRNSLIPGMIKTASFNFTRQNKNISIFESGNVSLLKDKKIEEEKYVSVLLMGNNQSKDHTNNEQKYDFYDIKGIADSIFEYFKININYKQSNENYLHPYQQADMYINDNKVGILGKVNQLVCESFDMTPDCFIMEFSLNKIFKYYSESIRYNEIPRFPSSSRDIALIIDKNITALDMIETIKNFKINILQEVKVFDIYKGENIEAGQYSIALSLHFNKMTATLTDSEVDEAIKNILSILEKNYNAKIR